MATEQTWGTILRTNNADLLVRIDTENGLEGALKTLGLGTKLQLKNIWGVKSDTIMRNERLLEFLRKGDFRRFKIFCEALVISGQESIVADHLSQVRVIPSTSTDMPDDPRSLIPLRESYRDCLRQNWNYLLEEIDNLNEIEAHLKSRESLTTFQHIQLQDLSKNLDKVSRLLTLLENGSQKLFDDFSEILNVTKKQYLVVTLTPSDAQRGLDNVKKTFLEVKLEPTSDIERQRKLKEIESEAAYPVSNGAVKGRVLIFSNRYFVDHRMKPRNGTEHDEKNLNDFFGTNLKFTTDLYSDMTSQEIRKTLKDEAKKDMSDFDIFIVFFLSHGKNGEIYGLDAKTVLTSEIVDCLDGKGCTQLVGKPKLIFIQACRNVYGTQVQDETDGLTPVLEMNNLTMNDADPKEKANPAPHDADPKEKANPAPHDAEPKEKANSAPHDADPKEKANPAPHDADSKEKANPAPHDAEPKEKANPAPHDAEPKEKANSAPHDADPKVKANPAPHDSDPKVKANPAPHDSDPKVKANPAPHDSDPKVKANPAPNDSDPKVKANPAPHDSDPKVKANPAPNDSDPKVKANPAPHDSDPKVKANPAPHDSDPKVKANPAPNDSDPKVKANPAPYDADPKVKANPAPHDSDPKVKANPAPNDADSKEKANPAPHDSDPKVKANPAPNDADSKEKANPAPHDSDPKVKANPAPHDADPKLKANLAPNDAVPEVETFPTYHVKADMAIFYATVRGDASYRREDEGSFFVRHLLDVFTRKAHTEDVLTMVTEALRLVHALQKRQLGEQKSSLLRKVYLVI